MISRTRCGWYRGARMVNRTACTYIICSCIWVFTLIYFTFTRPNTIRSIFFVTVWDDDTFRWTSYPVLTIYTRSIDAINRICTFLADIRIRRTRRILTCFKIAIRACIASTLDFFKSKMILRMVIIYYRIFYPDTNKFWLIRKLLGRRI